ncbi:hypothetical protein [Halodesulfovibrio sp. MK-HDV]|jgi:hypothetical protein|uniref:hypothetical protein n=1 Tax=Halodesulfovibrio sp. MK-HDV TaxID=2599925 RepID=UPI00136D7DD9|nr:hypothetical protein [Halodesulfovibrio sp. MK-HDV]KAF1073912.1 hypothetical protein MKHDV_03252 [Halodesulfovibrio sp. MK-HDV]
MLKDLGAAVGSVFKQRLENPIWSTFVLTWSIVNWKLLAFLFFSAQSTLTKLNIIDEKYSDPLHLWILPIFISAIYLFMMPTLIAFRDEQIKGAKIRALASQGAVETERYTYKLEAAEMEHRLLNTKSGNKERQDLLSELETVKEALEAATKHNHQLIEEVKHKTADYYTCQNNLKENEKKMLELLNGAEKDFTELDSKIKARCQETDASMDFLLLEYEKLLKEFKKQKSETSILVSDLNKLTKADQIPSSKILNILAKNGLKAIRDAVLFTS